ncbi:MAG: hypothetical protein ACI8XU_002801 [Kiritimatiellia bacterium]|jgi:hypothetical protein
MKWKISRISLSSFCLMLAIQPALSFSQSLFTQQEIEFVEQWLPLALESESMDDLVVGALMAQAHSFSASSAEFYIRALEVGNIDREIIHGIAARCASPDLKNECEELDILNQFQVLEPNNAIPFIYSALAKIENAELANALNDLVIATSKKTFDDRIIKRTFYIRKKLIEIGYPGERISHISNVYSIDNLNAQLYAALVNACNKMGRENTDWNEACKGLGELMEDAGNTYTALRVGQVILSNMLGFHDRDLIEQQSVDRRRAYTHRWRELASERLTSMKARNDAQDIFYEDWLERDEMYAMNQAMGRLDGKRVR